MGFTVLIIKIIVEEYVLFYGFTQMANLKKENDAIQAKEIGQGGLTQGQQTQMARNEQRIEQVEHTKI